MPRLTSPCGAHDAHQALPSSEETFAGALALMTAHAEAPAHRRAHLARTVSEYLMRIARHSCSSAECAQALSLLAAHWAALSDAREQPDQDFMPCRTPPATVQ